MDQVDIRAVVTRQLLLKINEECVSLCGQSSNSQFHSIPIDCFGTFNWKAIAADFEHKVPLLFTLLHSIAARNDHRNVVKIGEPIIHAAVLLKERNHMMNCLQLLISLLMYSCHAEMQV